MTTPTVQAEYADVNGLHLYYEIRGEGEPLVLLHGGLGGTSMFGENLGRLSQGRQLIAVELQGHGHTADIDRPITYEHLADDVSALITELGLKQADVMGYSLGGGTALQLAFRHPEQVRRLILVSTPFRRDAWYPESLSGMDQMGAAGADFLKNTPVYGFYASVAPRVEDFPRLLDKVGDLLRTPYDWSAQVSALTMPVLIVQGDADAISPAHAVDFYVRLGGAQRDGGWDRSGVPASRLAILPGVTHYDIFTQPQLADVVLSFLNPQ